jgi:hypothetical protein
MPLQQKKFLMPVMRKPSKINYPRYTQQLQPYNHYRKTLDCTDCPEGGRGGWVEIIRDNCCRPITRSGTTVLGNDYYPTREQYTYSRCETYEQRSSIITKDGTTKSTCTRGCTVVYNPNNKKFSQQGATSSGNRLQRLKYDTISKCGCNSYLPGTVNKSTKYGTKDCRSLQNIRQNKNTCS